MERGVLRKITALCIICGLAALALLGATAFRDEHRQWKHYQEDYKKLLLKKVSHEANPVLYERVVEMKPEIKQVVVDGLGSVDRCTTCHLGIEDPSFIDAPQPLTTHPDLALLKKHPVEKFGCTICHGGQGVATTYVGASHRTLAHWPHPMVKKSLMQSRCGYCHNKYQAIGADKLALGQKLFKEMHCSGCHKVDSAGGSIAPALSAFADKDVAAFDFSHIDGDHSKQEWVLEHYRNPEKVSPGSPMRIFAMNDYQIEALSTYVLSLSKRDFPIRYYSKKKLASIK